MKKDLERQYLHEIEWLKNKISTVSLGLEKRPSKQKEINDLRRQIKEREYRILFED